MAVVVSKKTEKSAVKRNRIRRRVFECVRKSGLLEGKSVDTVFVINDPSVGLTPHEELNAQITKACKNLLHP